MAINDFGGDLGFNDSEFAGQSAYDNFSFDTPNLSLQNFNTGAYDYGAGDLALGNWGYDPATYQNPLDQALWNGQGIGFDGGGQYWTDLGPMNGPSAPRPAVNRQLGPNNPAPPVGMTPRSSFGGLNQSGFRTWDTRTGPGGSNTPMARTAGGQMMNDMFARYNANMDEARRRAEADRSMALNRANQFGQYLNSADVQQYRQLAARLQKNPFGPEFLAQSVDRQREARMTQLAAAEANLKQHYANMGRTVPPSVLAYLRAQMAQQENSDLRNTQIDTAKLGFGADLDATQAYGQMVGQIGSLEQATNNALYNVLANTNYIPSGQELAFLMQLAQQGNG